jgi:uncharacterized protein
MEKFKRYVIFIIGLYINSFGVALITKASLGTSPISSIPYVLSLNFNLTLGNYTILFSILLILLQLLILRKDFKLEHLLQLPVSIAFGYFIDLSMAMLSFLAPSIYLMKIIYLLIGCLILGFGVYVEVLANVVMLPGESLVRAIVMKANTEFGTTKVAFDVTMTVGAVILSFLFSHKLQGVREGTIVAALLVGYISRVFSRLLSFLPEKLFGSQSSEEVKTAISSESTGLCITIGRQNGCGAHEIADELAARLGLKLYDKELIHMTSDESKLSEAFVTAKEEKMTSNLLFDLVNEAYGYSSEDSAPKDTLFQAQSKVIRNIAAEGNAIIIGRCSDYILKDQKNVLNIYLQAPLSFRAKRYANKNDLPLKDAEEKLKKNDRLRAYNYHYYTKHVWGFSGNYNLCLDVSYGKEYVIEQILHTISAMHSQEIG